MITIRWKGEEDLYRSMVRLEQRIERGSTELLYFAAEWLVNDIKTHWSANPQHVGSGNPPAIKTGNLDSSILSEQGRTAGGRFAANKDVQVVFVRIDTSAGQDPRNRGNYSQVLEFDYNLPFVEPAVERLSSVYPDLAKRFLR